MKLVALLVGTALALVPSGTAFAGDTGNGNAWGNCKNSSSGGVHAPLDGAAGNGNGGLQKVSRPGGSCAVTTPPGTGPVVPVPVPPSPVQDG